MAQRPLRSKLPTDRLGRYYTTEFVSHLLAREMGDIAPQTLLDLGCGGGALTRAVLSRWAGVAVTAVDIDDTAEGLATLSRAGAPHRAIHGDAVRLPMAKRCFDAVVCNPPFTPLAEPAEDALFAEAGLSTELGTAPAAFLAKCLRSLRPGGLLGFIAPEGLISGRRYLPLRAALLATHEVVSLIQLPRNAFEGTDARASIVIIRAWVPTSRPYPVRVLDTHGTLSAPSLAYPADAVKHLDGFVQRPTVPGRTLGALQPSLVRGTFAPNLRALLPFPLLHLSDLPSCPQVFEVPRALRLTVPPAQHAVVAEAGDILIARVGRNLHKKVVLVTAGAAALTDHVFRLRLDVSLRQEVFAALSSVRGHQWLADAARGVGARHLPKGTLLTFPLTAPQEAPAAPPSNPLMDGIHWG
ncbi:class I SAM-dependent methyltransferase [Paraburkholderia sp. UCT31]|uniref:N-6 DNA methylase n=1 Tax=Paraburkholderia sp. UCT31 TaxID=2615209 RepID=UPI0016550965|nr:class I SAM-dependent methyltransferase [Paraburkholderia sp. UCT31]MBC8738514.1 class I SAM-dependent methyltransferase [Paraburkholderia sp. UCT31]